ncbi:hypothetical protein SteCoe_12148 [Stentor coeruleus]|uniref:Uncharacterized protein n=1 Tax=Stentor coeruleus TaxID=5963 RepID=A0A1R2CBM2_9CILI|nr:hypothetical protein SteCoe_12148 [Stentor coeruleus]
MLSGITSVASSHGLSQKTKFQNSIPFIVSLTIGAELIGIVSLIVFYDKSEKSDNLLYISTVCYTIFCTIYFAWHSIVKENSFELLAFCLMSTILNAVAITLAIRHSVAASIKWTAVCLFTLAQIMFYLISLYLYRHFHHYILHDTNESVFERKLVAVSTFETFLSMIKLDFLLYSIILGTYFYYAAVRWDSFIVGGILIGVLLGIVLICHSVVGLLAATKEKKGIIIVYFIGMAITLIIKVLFVVILGLKPGDSLQKLVIDQCYVVLIGDVMVNSGIIYLGFWAYRSFGIGAISIIRKANDDQIKMSLI